MLTETDTDTSGFATTNPNDKRDPSSSLPLPTWIITLWRSTLNNVNRCTDPQNYMVMVFLHLIKPSRLLSEGALRKYIRALPF